MVTLEALKNKSESVAIVGLGYVGLPLAVELAKHFAVTGFDISQRRVADLKSGVDYTREVLPEKLSQAKIHYTADPTELNQCQFIIVAVPTPIDKNNNPDLSLVVSASKIVGQNFSAGSIISYESTVYPGVTEDVCLPILAAESGLKAHQDFKIAYSPERVNPGDREHTIDKITKVVSAEDAESLEVVAGVYGAITKVFSAASIKVAEAAKVIENTQRDLNIALMNELAIIFNKMGFSIYDVLAAADTKWNFLNFKPGLVGGHCIGVDPYYLTHRAAELGYKSEVILSGRKINDSMAEWLASQISAKLLTTHPLSQKPSVLVGGITFKENIPDVRNSKAADLVRALENKGITVYVIDPEADRESVEREYGLTLSNLDAVPKVNAIIMAVAHQKFQELDLQAWRAYCTKNPLLFDIKKMFTASAAESAGFNYWTL
ncbi:MAG: nucleotide sugar dehydrogenase [Candidatus Magasanikbacteria bacterium]|nr:nucleotide sugar dehydrogenase [Candidatus Magasanikbacteria bacterium]